MTALDQAQALLVAQIKREMAERTPDVFAETLAKVRERVYRNRERDEHVGGKCECGQWTERWCDYDEEFVCQDCADAGAAERAEELRLDNAARARDMRGAK